MCIHAVASESLWEMALKEMLIFEPRNLKFMYIRDFKNMENVYYKRIICMNFKCAL